MWNNQKEAVKFKVILDVQKGPPKKYSVIILRFSPFPDFSYEFLLFLENKKKMSRYFSRYSTEYCIEISEGVTSTTFS